MRFWRNWIFLSSCAAVAITAAFEPASHAQSSDLAADLVGGPAFTVVQASPTDPDVIAIPAGDQEPLVIRAVLTNTGSAPFVGIPASTLFVPSAPDPLLLSGVTGVVDGDLVFEGQGLTDVAAGPPFIGGFVLGPGESREFVLHVIYGLVCNGCAFPPSEPLLVPAPCGAQKEFLESTLDVRSAELIGGVVVADPDEPPDIRLSVNGPYPLTITVSCGTPEESIDDLLGAVGDLVDAAILNPGQGNALSKKLEGALAKLEEGKPWVAVNRLHAFIHQVQGFVLGGILTPAQGQALIDAAQAIIDQILISTPL